MKKKNFSSFTLLLMGLGSQLQIIASLSITELLVFLAAPILFVREWYFLKRNGFAPFFILSLLLVMGAGFACFYNHSPAESVLRGMAVVCLMPCSIVVCHWAIRRDMNGFKWFLVGVAISSVLCTFIFRRAVEVAMYAQGSEASGVAELIMGSPLYWIERVGSFLVLWPKGWYLQCPTFFCIAIPMSLAAFAILTSASGRSAAVCAVSGVVLVLLGGKTRRRINKRICKSFFLLVVIALVGAQLLSGLYRIAAMQGWLGEAAREKYYMQTKGKKGVLNLLMGGRMEAFCGLLACVDRPIIGFGPWPQDTGGYKAEFLRKFGDEEDYQRFMNMVEGRTRYGLEDYSRIPCHSHITEFWCWYGIFGLLFALYILFITVRYIKEDCWTIPQWYMWLAVNVPSQLWALFFSPVSSRVGIIMFSVAVLMVRAVRRGRQPLPMYMISELVEYERAHK